MEQGKETLTRIRQGHVGCKTFSAAFMQKFGITAYKDPKAPAVFFGVYKKHVQRVLDHLGPAVLVWAGSDILNADKFFISRLKKRHNYTHIAISNFISADLKKLGIPHRCLPITPFEYAGLEPCPMGKKIYVYLPDTTTRQREFYGGKFLDALRKKMPNQEFLVTVPKKHKQEALYQLYKDCFLGLRLTPHDGMSNTVIELGLMGRKVVWNGEAPNAVHYNTLDEVVQIIQEERKHIRKTDEALAKEVRKFITLSDDWLKVPYSVNTINPVDRTIGNGNVLPVKSAQDEYVTVIMNTVGEDPEVLRTAIKSYLNQNNVQVQLIISTIAGDPSLLLADELRLDVSVSPNKGIYEQLNYALQYVEGDWFCYASGNDLASPDKLQDETRLCIENKKLICYSDFKIVNEKWEPTGSRHFHEYDISRHLQGNFVSDCALIHRSIIDRFAPFDLRWGNHAYWDFWLRVYKALGDVFIYNRRAEWFYRVDGRNQHVQRKSDPVKKQANKDLMEKMLAYHRKSIRFK